MDAVPASSVVEAVPVESVVEAVPVDKVVDAVPVESVVEEVPLSSTGLGISGIEFSALAEATKISNEDRTEKIPKTPKNLAHIGCDAILYALVLTVTLSVTVLVSVSVFILITISVLNRLRILLRRVFLFICFFFAIATGYQNGSPAYGKRFRAFTETGPDSDIVEPSLVLIVERKMDLKIRSAQLDTALYRNIRLGSHF